MHPLANIKAGDLLKNKDGYFRRALSDVMYPQLGELATVMVSCTDNHKKSKFLKMYGRTLTLFELQEQGNTIHKEEPKEWPQIGDNYFYLDGVGDDCSSTYYNQRLDIWRKKSGNMFRTREEAIAKREEILSK